MRVFIETPNPSQHAEKIGLTKEEVEALDAEAKKDIEEATSFALASPEPTPESAMDFILA